MATKIVCPSCGATVHLEIEKGINQIVAQKIDPPPPAPVVEPPDNGETAIHKLINEGNADNDDGQQAQT